MLGGNLYDYLREHHNNLKLSQLLKFALDVSEGMEYLHHNNIIHRDLKTANLLLDSENVSRFVINELHLLLATLLFSCYLLISIHLILFCLLRLWKLLISALLDSNLKGALWHKRLGRINGWHQRYALHVLIYHFSKKGVLWACKITTLKRKRYVLKTTAQSMNFGSTSSFVCNFSSSM